MHHLPQEHHALFTTLQQELTQRQRLPIATYRLQFHAAFSFVHATALVPYLHALGISDCYTSPYLQARSGSLHGYDVVDYLSLNREIGTEDEYIAFVHTLQQHSMGQILDIVPNHMGVVGGANAWWQDVLEHGPASRYAHYFDIDWQPAHAALHNKVLLPILGDHYGKVLENQELRLTYKHGSFEVHYYEHQLPVAPCTAPDILHVCLSALQQSLGEQHQDVCELQRIITLLRHLPERTEQNPERIAERSRDTTGAKHRLAMLYETCPALQAAVTQALHTLNGTKGEPHSFDRLHELLEAQSYRLSFWRVATDAVNYRRFFDIHDLAAMRMEDPTVYAATHDFILHLLAEGHITGLRVDHPDGLYDPSGYFQRLQWSYVHRLCQRLLTSHAAQATASLPMAPEALADRYMAIDAHASQPSKPRPLYVVAEKILEEHESLRDDWLVYGTTGYDFLNLLNRLFVDQAHADARRTLYTDFVQEETSYADILYTAKKDIMDTSMASDITALSAWLARLAANHRAWRDCTHRSLHRALRELIAYFPVYRTYIRGSTEGVSPLDRAVIDTAVTQARRCNPTIDPAVFTCLHDVLLLHAPAGSGETERQAQVAWVQKFQQVTGPVMAKGLEDTAFYRYTPLVSLNEVGGNPDPFGVSVTAFHQHNLTRLQHWPHTLLATSTHDTKRSEDVRARLNVLSEMLQPWHDSLWRWHRLNRHLKTQVDAQLVPSRQEEYLLYQTLLGAWPFEELSEASLRGFQERMQAYMRKALREAKVHTSWLNPYGVYEEAVDRFIAALLDADVSGPFLEDFHRFQQIMAYYGIWNALAQTLLKMTVPGVPDFYQGSELWDFSLVDPDNRRPVDFNHRQQLLTALQQRCQKPATERLDLVRELLQTPHDGCIKLYVTWQALTYRRSQAAVFQQGVYIPLETAGGKRDHVCAFARMYGDEALLVLVPRLIASLQPAWQEAPLGQAVWGDTALRIPEQLAGGSYHQLFTGATIHPVRIGGHAELPVATVFAEFPVALLQRL